MPSDSRSRAITAAPPTPKPGGPKRAGPWHRHLRRAALAGLLLFAAFVAWLFWPVELPPEPLLARLPADLVWGVELREGALFWRQDCHEAATELLATPLAHELLGPKPAAQALIETQKIAARVDAALAQPFNLGLAGRALSGALACGGRDLDSGDFALVAKPGNYVRLLGRLALWLKGRPSRNGQFRLLAGELPLAADWRQPVLLTLRDGHLLAAGSESRLAEILAGWGRPPARNWPNLPPTPTLTALFRPDPAARRLLGEKLGHEFWLAREMLAIFHPPQIETAATRIGADLQLQLLDKESVNPRQYPIIAPPAQVTVVEPPADSYVYAAGWAAPEFAWTELLHRLWPESDRPLRGVNQPASVFLYEWLERGVVRPAAGGFALGLGPAQPGKARVVVPPLPEIWAAWSIRPEALAEARREFAAGMGRLIEFYTAPGGDTYYQEVRRVTRLIPASTAQEYDRLELQPLFHAYAAPAWRLAETGPIGPEGIFGTSVSALLARRQMASRQIEIAAADALARIDFRFAPPPQAVAEWRAVILDKVERHGFLQPEERGPLLQLLAGLDAWAQSGLEATGQATLRPQAPKPSSPLILNARLELRRRR